MSTTTSTGLRTLATSDANNIGRPGTLIGTTPEPAILERERALLREILRLVDERANAEASVEAERTSSATTADTEYEKARRTSIEKLQGLESEAIKADEKKRRSIVDGALEGERRAKSEFAAASRKLATLFDSAREVCKNRYNDDKTAAASSFDSGQRKAAKDFAEKTKPVDDCARMAAAFRERLAVLARDYAKFKLNAELPPPTRESYDRYSNPSDELFTRLARIEPPLKLLESLIIPKSMKGAREVWVFLFTTLPLLGIALGMGLDVYGITAAAVVGAVVGIALRMWLFNLSKHQLESRYSPLMHNLADCGALERTAAPWLTRRSRKIASVSPTGATKSSRPLKTSIAGRSSPRRPSATSDCARSTRFTPSAWSKFKPASSSKCATHWQPTSGGSMSCAPRPKRRCPVSRRNIARSRNSSPRRMKPPGAPWPSAGVTE